MLQQRKISVSVGFWILLGWFALANGIGLTVMILLAALCHEVGHLLAICWQGGTLYSISVTVFGAEMEVDTSNLSYGSELTCVLAGVAVNGVCGWAFGQVQPVFAGVHWSLCVLNLLPIRPLDGGRALALVLRWGFDPVISEWVTTVVERCVALILGVGLTWLVWETGGSLWLVPAAMAFLRLAVIKP
ncbi:hypothetical protein RFF05_01475 [Bengtsoniella intestinalis]|uniref:hypothetical protein n=1 Tax=Bengtsoniella intestinalis TaxID=3073143 RepID=UPI00391EF812